MATHISPRDYEYLSAYLDGQLRGADLQRLEARLEQDPSLRSELEAMRRTQVVLRSLPCCRAPRNFTLTPQMVGQRQRVTPRLYPVMGFASALASLLFVLVVLGDFLGYIPFATGGSESAEVQEAAPLALVLTEEVSPDASLMQSAPALEDAAAPLETEASAATDVLRQAPTQEEGALVLEMAPPGAIITTEATEPSSAKEVPADAPLLKAVEAGTGTDTLEMPLEVAVTPQPSDQPATKLLATESTPTPTLTFTPTPMPTETPVATATMTFTPTPAPTETPPFAFKEVVEEQPSPTPTLEIRALAGENDTGEALPAALLDESGETNNFLAEEQAPPPGDGLRPLLALQIGLLAMALITGLTYLVLRFKQN